MRIAYGIHGFGRGHAMRAMSVLPKLAQRHELLLLAGGDAYNALHREFPVLRIPTLKYHYGRRGKLSNYLNLKRNASMVLDLFLGGPAFQMVEEALADFKPDVVLTDSEGFTHRVAAHMGVPRITFDHFGILVYCRPAMAGFDNVIRSGNAFVYRTLFGEPDRAVVSSFFDAPAVRPGVVVVGPAIREAVRQTPPTRGSHLLAYINKGEHEYTPQIEQALLSLDCPVRLYGTPYRDVRGNIQFKPIANLPFIEDLASSRAVFATTGNQLFGEVTYYGKPAMGMPMACLEQRLNAMQLEVRGVGKWVRRRKVTPTVLHDFFAREEEFGANAQKYKARDGEREALEAIERFAGELMEERAASSPRDDRTPAGSAAARETAETVTDAMGDEASVETDDAPRDSTLGQG